MLVHASVVPEPFGQVVAQGMAAGVPVVAADAGGPAEMIDDGVNGFVVPAGDALAPWRRSSSGLLGSHSSGSMWATGAGQSQIASNLT